MRARENLWKYSNGMCKKKERMKYREKRQKTNEKYLKMGILVFLSFCLFFIRRKNKNLNYDCYVNLFYELITMGCIKKMNPLWREKTKDK